MSQPKIPGFGGFVKYKVKKINRIFCQKEGICERGEGGRGGALLTKY